MLPIEQSEPEQIRGLIFKLFADNKIPISDAEKILAQCLSFVRDTEIIKKTASGLGLKLSGFDSNKALELYYDIEKEEETVGDISKGWDEPGFRLCRVLLCKAENLASFKENSYTILNTCATQGVALGVRILDDGLGLELFINIYQDGFNTSVLKNALETLESTFNKLKLLLKQ